MGDLHRRSFLGKLGLLSGSAFLANTASANWQQNLHQAIRQSQAIPAEQLAKDEDFWYTIQQAYTVSPSLINLNNGGVAPSPKTVQEAMKRYHDLSNEEIGRAHV